MTETLEQNYDKAGYHAKQSYGAKPALILVDFAQAYFDPDAPLYGGEGCVAARDHVARLHPRSLGWAVFENVRNQCASHVLQAERFGNLRRDSLDHH